MATLKPDVLAVQECEPLDNELFLDGGIQPTFRDRLPREICPGRGVALFSYSDVAIESVGNSNEQAFRRFEARKGDIGFNVVAAWTWDAKPASRSYRQIHEGLENHSAWVRSRPTVLLGDFNMNASFKGKRWPDLMNLLDSLELQSAYHSYFAETFGQETRHTHFFRGEQQSRFHLDYCFLPRNWVEAITTVTVGAHADWHKQSDHSPLVVDLDESRLRPAA